MKKENWESRDTCVYFGDGGIDIRHAPDALNRARLIASAPALLDALEELLYGTFPDGVDDDGSGRIGFSDACVKRYNKAKAAIAAARGDL